MLDYFEEEQGRRSAAKLLSKDEAASDCGKLCEAAGAVEQAPRAYEQH